MDGERNAFDSTAKRTAMASADQKKDIVPCIIASLCQQFVTRENCYAAIWYFSTIVGSNVDLVSLRFELRLSRQLYVLGLVFEFDSSVPTVRQTRSTQRNAKRETRNDDASDRWSRCCLGSLQCLNYYFDRNVSVRACVR